MKFGVIYTVDIYGEKFQPAPAPLWESDPKHMLKSKRAWRRTENTKSADEGVVAHGKWVALLTREQLKELFSQMGFYKRSQCDTMGALGTIGPDGFMTYGLSPAWSFNGDDPDVAVNVYVTPWPEITQKSGVSNSEKNLNRIGKALHCLF